MTLPAVVSPHLKFSTGDFHMDIHLSTLILRPRTGQPRTTSVRIAALRIAALWLCMATVTVAAIFADELPLRDSARTETPIAEHWAVGESTIQEPVASGEISLFDGTTLNGWSGDPRYWTVENGAITGTTTAEQPLDANSFLIWRDGEVDDFELKIKFRIEGGNSGVQYRSQDLGEHHVGGYQADIDGSHQYVGILYEERGRGILANRATKVEIDEKGEIKVVGKTCDEAALLASINANEWSEYTITARKNHLTQAINGFVTVDVVDGQTDQAKSHGILALQIHAGPPMKVQFKDVRLRRFSAVAASPTVVAGPAFESGCPASNACNCCQPQSHRCARRPFLGGFFRR